MSVRQTSFVESAEDSLKAMFILTSWKLRRHAKETTDRNYEDKESEIDLSFFDNYDRWIVPDIDYLKL